MNPVSNGRFVMHRGIRGLFAVGLGIGLSLTSGAVAAQQADARSRAEAQKLYEDGAKDLEDDDYAHACPKFEAAWKILPDHVRTGLTLADCLDKWGKPAAAHDVLEKVAFVAKKKGDTQKLAELQATMADLDKRVPRLTIRVPEDVATMPGFALTRSGVPLPAATWGRPMPLDPGEYEIEATAVDRPAWTKNVKLVLQSSTEVVITPGWEKPKPKVIVVSATWPARMRMAGIVSLGVGGVGLAAWGILGGLAISRNNASKAHCNGQGLCDIDGFTKRTEAVSFAKGATASLVAGSIFGAAGVTLMAISIVGKKDTKRNTGIHVTNVLMSPSMVGIGGRW